MPVRTSAVVAGGLLLLGVVGVTTIFGESLLAWIAPPAGESFSSGVTTGGLQSAGSSSRVTPNPAPPGAGPTTTSTGSSGVAGDAAVKAEGNP